MKDQQQPNANPGEGAPADNAATGRSKGAAELNEAQLGKVVGGIKDIVITKPIDVPSTKLF